MNFTGFILGAVMFVIIGAGHVMIIKGEYHFGTSWWPLLLVVGVALAVLSLYVPSPLWSGIMGIAAFIFLYSIRELFQQKQRVEKGWFPKKSEGGKK